MTKAYSYIRFSTPGQLKGDSLRRQLSKSEEFAAKNGLELDSSARDLGLSGFKGDHRIKGALAAILAKIETGEIERGSWLIVENLDRLSRENVLNAIGLFLQIVNAGMIVATLSDNMVYSVESISERPNDLSVSVSAFIKANLESVNKSTRLGDAWAEKRRDISENPRRKLTAQGPRWLDLVPDDVSDPLTGEWVENDRVATVRQIFAMCLSGMGKGLIAKQLNEANVPAFRGGDGWQQSTVLYLLRDRRVLGEFQPQSGKGRERHPIGAPIEGYFPQIISVDTFHKAQNEIRHRWSGASVGRKGQVKNLFLSIAKCSCGRVMEYRDTNASKENCGSACKRDPLGGVIGVQKGPLISMV